MKTNSVQFTKLIIREYNGLSLSLGMLIGEAIGLFVKKINSNLKGRFMKILLIYKSKTGFTEKYAKWISKEIECDVVNISNIQNVNFKNYDIVIYGSRIQAGRIDGLERIKNWI